MYSKFTLHGVCTFCFYKPLCTRIIKQSLSLFFSFGFRFRLLLKIYIVCLIFGKCYLWQGVVGETTHEWGVWCYVGPCVTFFFDITAMRYFGWWTCWHVTSWVLFAKFFDGNNTALNIYIRSNHVFLFIHVMIIWHLINSRTLGWNGRGIFQLNQCPRFESNFIASRGYSVYPKRKYDI